MTILKKTVVRKCAKPLSNKRYLIVQLEPGDILSLRESHGRKCYDVSLEGLFYQMVRSNIGTERERIKKDKKNKIS